MSAYYNEIDPFAAQWLRNLIAAGQIAPGDVDERDIRDVRPSDLAGYRQCHFFAGVGVWSYALRMAGTRDDANVWTGSCPCQPFSQAGSGAGFDDERHLWPHFHYLISQCRPAKVFGEQVASKDGLGWIDLVQADLEGSGYAVGAADMCAAGFGAPHIRQRLYWVADATNAGLQRRRPSETCDGSGASGAYEPERLCTSGELGYTDDSGSWRHAGAVPGTQGAAGGCVWREPDGAEPAGSVVPLADMCDARLQVGSIADVGRGALRIEGAPAHGVSGELADACEERQQQHAKRHGESIGGREESARRDDVGGCCDDVRPAGPTNGFWRDADWLLCRDGKWRPVEPGTFPLAHGAAGRVGRLLAYGNAIVAEQAIGFIEACTETLDVNVEK